LAVSFPAFEGDFLSLLPRRPGRYDVYEVVAGFVCLYVFLHVEAFDSANVGDHVEYEIVRVLTGLAGHSDSDGLEFDWVLDSE
jgi:hypothetical protein